MLWVYDLGLSEMLGCHSINRRREGEEEEEKAGPDVVSNAEYNSFGTGMKIAR